VSPIPDMTVQSYMRDLNSAKWIVNSTDVEAYVLEVTLASKRRAVLDLAQSFAAKAPTAGHDIIGQLSAGVAALVSGDADTGIEHMKEHVSGAFQRIMENDSRGWGPTGYRSKFREIDNAIGGWQRKKLYYIAAMEKAGKTALALSLARHFLLQDIPVAMFSLELKKDELSERMIMLESGICVTNRTEGCRLTEEELELLSSASDRVESWPWHVDDIGSLSPSLLTMKARHAARAIDAKIIIVDYLQIIDAEDGEDGENTRGRIERASNALRRIAKDLDVCVIGLCQLNRKALERATARGVKDFDVNAGRPRKGDTRETAKIEMDADAIVAIYRPEIFIKELRPVETADNAGEMLEYDALLTRYRGRAELSVLLNRSGPDGVRQLCRFDGPIMRFDPIEV
jgi:replicative DNA helicase